MEQKIKGGPEVTPVRLTFGEWLANPNIPNLQRMLKVCVQPERLTAGSQGSSEAKTPGTTHKRTHPGGGASIPQLLKRRRVFSIYRLTSWALRLEFRWSGMDGARQLETPTLSFLVVEFMSPSAVLHGVLKGCSTLSPR
jgi:hypothetical protein